MQTIPPEAGGASVGFLGGAKVSLAPAGGEGPFYLRGGVWSRGATRTIPGAIWNQGTGFAPFTQYTGTEFINVPSGEYDVTIEDSFVSCSVEGVAGSPTYGYARAGGVIRAPVLPGFRTGPIASLCFCLDSNDERTCGEPDAGAF